MRITKYGHACVRLEHAGVSLVVDPGLFADAEVLAGADAVLITHEHPDHYQPELLRTSSAAIYTIDAVATKIRAEIPEAVDRLHVVAPGDVLDLGLRVEVFGEQHAVIHPDLPRFFNSGYLFDLGGSTVFHPGDALDLPKCTVDVLMVPSSAPWLRSADAVDFARAVGAPTNLAIHDRVYTEFGHGVLDTQMKALLGSEQRYLRVPDGTDLD
ncbi:MBL fold metallo-hydrolase [Nocardioides sp. Bht2]|uniref:MBL fold metallo-hydrolase n=1 Tax=Nocardioides sp. Bht2 TaxID=3392297 RepID=UPI0039B3961E